MKVFVVKKSRIIAAIIAFIILLPCVMYGAEKPSAGVCLPILMYHQTSKNPSKWGKYVISPEEFEKDIVFLKEKGYEAVVIKDIIDFIYNKKPLPERPVMLTFDDGFESDYEYVFPILKKHNVKAVFSVVGAYTDIYSESDVIKHINYSHLSWEQIKEMEKSGLAEFQCHSYDLHTIGKRKGAAKIKDEAFSAYETMLISDTNKLLQEFEKEKITKPLCYTYPFGSLDKSSEKVLLSMGFSASLGAEEKLNYLSGKKEELYKMKRFNRHHGRDISKLIP